jgi:uncharacterized integral membrane protein (TIGR00698 family)
VKDIEENPRGEADLQGEGGRRGGGPEGAPRATTGPAPTPGLTLAALVALVATLVPAGLGLLPGPWARVPVSPILVSIVLGVALAGAVARRPTLHPGLALATGPLLKLAVILIGLRLGLGELFELGLSAIPLVLAVIVLALGAALGLSRAFGVPPRLGALLAVGTAICGASAIAATAPGLRARAEEVAYAIACVALFGLVATLVYPPLFHVLLADPRAVGTALGAAIHDTAQVTGAALFYEQIQGVEGALTAASVTKLMRNLGMLVVIPLVVWAYGREGDAGGAGARGREGRSVFAERAPGESVPGESTAGNRGAGCGPDAVGDPAGAPRAVGFPLFVLGFVAASLVRTAGDRLLPGVPAGWSAFLSSADAASAFLFAMAMAALGMSIRPAALVRLGWRPAGVALATALLVGALAVLWVRGQTLQVVH